MLKLDWHFYKEDSAEKMVFSLDWFTFEDHWTQLYMFERPMWEPELLERARIRNNNRCKWFRISANVMHLKIYLDFKLKKVVKLRDWEL